MNAPADAVLLAVGLHLARASALVVSSPVLGIGSHFAGYKIGLSVALALLLYAVAGEPLAVDVGPIGYAALLLREILIGLFLAFALHLVLVAIQVAGEMVGHEMGFLVARQVDPATGVPTPLVTSMYETFFVLALLALNGHHWLVRALAASCERAPVGELSLGGGLGGTAQRVFGEMFAAGIVFAAPVLSLLLIATVAIGVLARAVPHLNVLEVGYSIRILLALFAMLAFAPLLAPALEDLHRALQSNLSRALDALGG